MLARLDQAIAAIATAPGRGAVGIVRVSAKNVQPVIDAVCGRALKPREATYLPFRAVDGSAIDQGLAIHFPAPHSYTGEDVLELQAHGGPVVLQLLLARCLEAGAAINLRVAEPGEFTQRAFLNGKLDLAQAEAIADLIDASTEAAARSATRSLAGEFSREIHALRDALVDLRMLVEATLDFPEEEIDFLRKADAQGQLERLQAKLARVMQRAHQGALLREGIDVVIAGQPNAGKSSLLNALAGAELAIVTPIPGTTRDVVRQTIQIEGVPLHVVDTAGLREGADQVEQIGIERAWGQIEKADAVLFLHDLTRADSREYQEADAAIAAKLPKEVPVVDVWNKVDVRPAQTSANPAHTSVMPTQPSVMPAHASAMPAHTSVMPAHTSVMPAHTSASPAHTSVSPEHTSVIPEHTSVVPEHTSAGPEHTSVSPEHTSAGPAHTSAIPAPPSVIPAQAGIQGTRAAREHREPWIPASAGMTGIRLSAKTGEGLDDLRRKLLALAGWQSAPEGVFIARERHLHALRRVDAHLMEAAAHLAREAQALDLLAEELRLAQNALSEITGEFSADDLLGVIFSRFCIGK